MSSPYLRITTCTHVHPRVPTCTGRTKRKSPDREHTIPLWFPGIRTLAWHDHLDHTHQLPAPPNRSQIAQRVTPFLYTRSQRRHTPARQRPTRGRHRRNIFFIHGPVLRTATPHSTERITHSHKFQQTTDTTTQPAREPRKGSVGPTTLAAPAVRLVDDADNGSDVVWRAQGTWVALLWCVI